MFPPDLPSDTQRILQSLSRLTSLDTTSLFFKWESFLFAHPDASLLSAESVGRFQREVLNWFNESKVVAGEAKSGNQTAGKKAKKRLVGMDFGSSVSSSSPLRAASSATASTPLVSRSKIVPGTPATPMPPPPPLPSTPFSLRPPSQTLETLNAHLPSSSSSSLSPNASSKVSIKLTRPLQDYDYKYMYEKLSLKAQVLDGKIDQFALGPFGSLGTLADPSLVSDAQIVAVGRIQSDDETVGKLSAMSCVLEGSRFLGSGQRIPLRFSQSLVVSGGALADVAGVALFPGMIVAVKGRNGQGGWFGVDEIVLPPPLPLPASSRREQFQYAAKMNGPMRMIAASGPFTLDSDLEYEPFRALLQQVRRERPDVLILSGPFVPSTHSELKVGNTTLSPAEIFRLNISKPLGMLLDDFKNMRVLLYPAVRDLIGQHFAFPQTMLDKKDPDLDLPKRVTCLPNPCVINLNEVVFGNCTVDTLLHLKKEEHYVKAKDKDDKPDAIANLCRTILSQRNFYPIFPPPASVANEVNLDLTHLQLADLGDSAPDLFITSSNLKPFAKIVDSTVVINPGFLTKGSSAGSFARVTIQPPTGDPGAGEEDRLVEHKIYERCKVELVKL